LFIEHVDVRRRAYVSAGGGYRAEARAGPDLLDVQFELSGYLRGEAG
jgi:hypothetical protein